MSGRHPGRRKEAASLNRFCHALLRGSFRDISRPVQPDRAAWGPPAAKLTAIPLPACPQSAPLIAPPKGNARPAQRNHPWALHPSCLAPLPISPSILSRRCPLKRPRHSLRASPFDSAVAVLFLPIVRTAVQLAESATGSRP